MPAATIKLFLPNGEAQSLRVAEISNWNGKAIAAPRTELNVFLKREELDKPGVYLLLGADAAKPFAYIGEAEVVRDRLRQHNGKDWVQALVFVSQGENLTKAHTRYLEGRLIAEASKAGRYAVTNAVASGAKLPESDRQDMEVFLARMRQLLPVLGCELLVQALPSGKAVVQLFCRIKGLVATGRRTASGFLICKDSQAVPTLRPCALKSGSWVSTIRQQLLQSKVLLSEKDCLRFSKDYEFKSPSAAATIIRGGNASGLTEWRDAHGKTLKDLDATDQSN
jgi:Domain of unknown function (DUF4357)